jgi:hypothetical protein
MGELLMSAPISRSVANLVSQVSQPATTLRQCDSCPYPFRDRAPTVALSLSECWRGKRSVAKECFAASPIVSTGWRFSAKSTQGRLTGQGQKLSKSQINVLKASIWLSDFRAPPQRGFSSTLRGSGNRTGSSVCTETKKPKKVAQHDEP